MWDVFDYPMLSSLGPVGARTAVIKYVVLVDTDDASESHCLVTASNLECSR